MTIIDLRTRLTQDWKAFHEYSASADSLVYIGGTLVEDRTSAAVELTVGSGWYDCKKATYYEIPEDGLALKPGRAVVIETEQVVAVPQNAFGIVTGKGRYIFQGVLISSGKIDPGFADRLRIGMMNGGSEQLLLKRGDPFCSCCFLNVESGLEAPPQLTDLSPSRRPAKVPARTRAARFLRSEWSKVVPIAISLAALGVAIYTNLLKTETNAGSRRESAAPNQATPNRK